MSREYAQYAEKVYRDELTITEAAFKLNTTVGKLRRYMKENGYLDENGNKMKENTYSANPCGVCAEYFCEWLQFDKPVPGWDAEPVSRIYSTKRVRSYHIKSCPKFRRMK